MLRTRFAVWFRLAFVILFVLALVPARPSAAAQVSGDSYQSSFGYTVTWSEDWTFDESFSLHTPGVVDLITLWHSDSAFLMVTGYAGVADPATVLEPLEGDVVVSSDLEGEVPQMVTESEGFRTIAEAYSIDDGAITIVVSLTATASTYDDMLATAPDTVQVNDSPVLLAQPLADSTAATDVTGEEGDADTDTGVTRTTRNAETPTPEAQTTTGGTRTTRTTRTAGKTEVFVGPVYGYSVEYNPDTWTVEGEYEDEGTDGVTLASATSTLTIWAWNGYGADPVACLDGEAAFYATEVESISDWEPVMDANGQPLRGESADAAWGVYRLTYQNENGEPQSLVDYISCQAIPGQDAMLIVLLSSAPENYNDNLDLTFEITDTLQFDQTTAQVDPTGEAQPTEVANQPATETATVAPDARAEIDTSFDGTNYTSPLYGFTVYVPLEWQIVSETVDGGEERLVLTNGASEVTLWATNAEVGDLSACVDYAAANSGKDLTLLENSTGGPFRGEYGEEAFGNFVYTEGGVQMMYFISCRPIGDTGAVLILVHDVPYDQFTYERRFRNEIEDSITMP
jgi:hypothetical protein